MINCTFNFLSIHVHAWIRMGENYLKFEKKIESSISSSLQSKQDRKFLKLPTFKNWIEKAAFKLIYSIFYFPFRLRITWY